MPDNAIGGTCLTCKFHDVDGFYEDYGKAAEGMGETGYCRRYPPRPGDLSLVADALKGEGKYECFRFGDWPETTENEWCGEYVQVKEPDENEG